jgi:DNA-damage-inducible protein J
MTERSVVRARIDERTKQEAAAVLKSIGLTPSDAFRLLLVRVAAEKALPFELLTPNEETVEAMRAARRGAARGPHRSGPPQETARKPECPGPLNTPSVSSVTTAGKNPAFMAKSWITC